MLPPMLKTNDETAGSRAEQPLRRGLLWLPGRLETMVGKLGRWLNRRMPKRLYARSLLIVITPMILLQSVVAFVFMERHWQTVTQRLSTAVVRDIAALIDVIAGYTIRLGETVKRRRIRATVLLHVEPRSAAALVQRLKAMPQVESCHSTTGRVDLILQLVAETTGELDEALDRIGAIPGVRDTESLIQLSCKFDRRT